MTPKEKADRLCMDMLLQIECNCQPSIYKMIAKKCALIAVDEILRENSKRGGDNDDIVEFEPYWKEVKEEIEKL